MQKRIKQFLSSEFNRNVFLLFSGSGIAQAIPILATVILTRVYSEQEFGTFFLYSSIVTILTVISNLKIESTIVLSSDNQEARQLFSLGVQITWFLSSLLLLLILLFKPLIASKLGVQGNNSWLLLIPLATFLNSFIQLSNSTLVRLKKYKRISLSNIIKSSSLSSYQIIAGFIKASSWQLIVGNIFGLITASISNLLKIYKHHFTIEWITGTKAKALIIKYKEFPLFSTFISLTNAISRHIPIILLTTLYGLKIAGLYGLSLKIIGVPLLLMSQSYSEVFYREASQIYHHEPANLKRYVRQNYWSLFKLGIIPFLLLFIAAPFIFEVVFGENWNTSGVYTRILAPWLFLTFLNAPILRVLSILRKQRFLLGYNTLLLITRVVCLYLGYIIFQEALFSVLLYSLAGVLFNIFIMVYMLKLTYTRN
ncbi:MAG: oligosaccharide flippase family protein [Bacteroidetes bacterium]|nr:oligosaccharide flippase family protein [Bacteroidota bacterium]